MKSVLHQRALLAIAAATLWTTLASAQAASIGVNFTGTDFLAPADAAGVAGFTQTHYNNVSSPVTNLILNDDSGAATTATLTLTATLFGAITAVAPTSPDEMLNRGAVAGSFADFSFTLNNIPYSSYSIVVYDLGGGEGDVHGITVGGTTFYSSSPGPSDIGYVDALPATPYLYTQATSTDPGAPTRLSNYVLFTGLSGLTQTVFISGDAQRPIGGFQIVQTIPEPSTCAMLLSGLGLLGYGCFGRTGKR